MLFAQLSLATQQCGVSWRIVWDKRHFYAEAFHDWDMHRVAAMTQTDLARLVDKSGPWAGKVIQNAAKLSAIVHNARECLRIEEEHAGGLCGFLWSFVDNCEETVNTSSLCHGDNYSRIFGVTSSYSDALAKAMRKSATSKYNFKFLGSITLQAFLLQNGLLNGHSSQCHRNPRCKHRALSSESVGPTTPVVKRVRERSVSLQTEFSSRTRRRLQR
eukprot:6199585-Pleurochrysis_carterae.AAC.2